MKWSIWRKSLIFFEITFDFESTMYTYRYETEFLDKLIF